MGNYDEMCAEIHPSAQVVEQTWCWGAAKLNDVQELTLLSLQVFSSDKGCIVHVREKPAVSTFGVLPRVLSLFYVLLHRSSIAPVRCARCSGRQATFQ